MVRGCTDIWGFLFLGFWIGQEQGHFYGALSSPLCRSILHLLFSMDANGAAKVKKKVKKGNFVFFPL